MCVIDELEKWKVLANMYVDELKKISKISIETKTRSWRYHLKLCKNVREPLRQKKHATSGFINKYNAKYTKSLILFEDCNLIKFDYKKQFVGLKQ